jgi:hypothetical protein
MGAFLVFLGLVGGGFLAAYALGADKAVREHLYRGKARALGAATRARIRMKAWWDGW